MKRSIKKELQFIKKQLNRMQDFEYEYNIYDVKDFEHHEKEKIKRYGLGEMNVSYFDYYDRRSK